MTGPALISALADALRDGAVHRGFIDIADLSGFCPAAVAAHGQAAFVAAIHGREGNPADPSIAALNTRAAEAIADFQATRKAA